MEPYRPNEPFIKLKLDGSLLDRMVEAGIPFTRAIQYFRDNPEGSAMETLSRVADELVPFKYNIQNNGSATDFLKEAVLIGLPVKGVRGAARQIDKVATEQYNKQLANNIRKQAPSWKQEDFLKLTEERPVQPGEFDVLKMYDVDVPYTNQSNIVYASPEGVRGRVEPLEAQTVSELIFDYPFMDEVTSNTGWAIPRNSLANKQYSPTEYLNRWQENYRERNPDISSFDKGVANIYSPNVMTPNITNIERRLLNPGNVYNYTINEIRDANSTLSKAAATDYANSTIFKHKDAYLNEIAQVDPVAADNLNNMYNKYLETLVSDIPKEEKATLLRVITEDINAEINMFNLMNEE